MTLDIRSQRRLHGVDPSLAKVFELAATRSPLPMQITEGRRDANRQKQLVAKGASRTMKSRHLIGNAVDFHILNQDGTANWDLENYRRVWNEAILPAAQELGVEVEWGGDWKSFKDGPHVQLKSRNGQPAQSAQGGTRMAGGGGAATMAGGEARDTFQKVTDPEILKQLNTQGNGLSKVTDPAILQQLGGQGGKPATPQPTQAQPAQPRQAPQMPEGMVQMPNGYILDTNAIVEDSFRNQGLAPYITGLAGNFLQGAPFIGEYIDEIIGARGDIAGEVPGLRQELARAYQRKFAELYPNTAMAAQITGGVVSTVPLAMAAAPAVAAAAPATLAGQVAAGAGAGAAAGAVEGAVSGFGAGTGGVANRTQSAIDRAEVGGVLGGAIGAAAPVVARGVGAVAENLTARNTKGVARSQGVSQEAAELTGRMLDNDGGMAAARNMDAPDAMLADAGPATAGLLDATIQKAGPAGAQARQAIADRTISAAADIDDALNLAFGSPRMVAARNPAAAKRLNALYNRAYARPIDYTSASGREIESLLDRVPKSAFQEAERLMQVEGVQSAQRLVRVLDDGRIVVARYPDVRQLDYITRSLNDIAKAGDGKGALGGNTNMGRVHAKLSRELRTALKDAVPEWGVAVNQAATEIGLKEARELGEVVMSAKTTRGDLFEALQDMGDAEIRKLKEGIRANIDDTLANVKRTAMDASTEAREGLKALKDLSSRSSKQKLELVLGKREADALTKRLDRASRAYELRARTADNSKTFARLSFDEAIKDITEPSALGKLLEGSPVKAGQRLVQAMTNMTPVARRQAEEKVAGDIARLLTQKRGPDAARVLNELVTALEKDQAGMALAQLLRREAGALTVVAGDQAQVPLQMNRPQ